MKLLIITAVAQFENEVKQILKKAQIKTFSYREVTGYRNTSEDAIESNWFGTEMNENESILFYAFVENEKIDSVFNAIDEFNAKQETLSHIHSVIINIKKSN
jgi:nitrogen regulatory protein PII